jgi:hypothetical protein
MRFRNFVTFCVIAAGSFITMQAFAQTITTGTVPTSLCPGDTVYVPFSATGTFQPKNAFTAQLSNSYGNFDSSYASIGTTKDSSARQIMGVIPTFESGSSTHFRIRVISGYPFIEGADNGSNITIGTYYGVNFIPSRWGIFQNDTVTFINNSPNNGTYLWNFGDGASPQTSTAYNPGPVTYSTTGVKTISLSVTSPLGCTNTLAYPLKSQYDSRDYFTVFDCYPAIPHSAIIVDTSGFSYNVPDTNDIYVWVVPGGSLRDVHFQHHTTIFIEPGGYINLSGNENLTIYVKNGGTCVLENMNSVSVVSASESGIINLGSYDVPTNAFLQCSSLDFDYTNAPTYNPTLVVNEKITSPLSISLYPNPANDMLHVFTGATMSSSVRLFNALGEEVWSAAGHVTNSVQIATDNLQNGVYYLQVVAAGAMRTEKVTVIH